MIKKSKTPFLRDTFLAYLIKGAKRTKTDEFPIIENWMVAKEAPKNIVQRDRRYDVKDAKNTAMSFYCNDINFQPILGNPKKYLKKLKCYSCVIGIDASPYDNMPIWIQKSQIGLNLGITYFYGSKGIKIIPNVRLGGNCTLSSLEAYPHNTLIAVGTNGFIKAKENKAIFAMQLKIIVDTLNPSGICVYGPTPKEIFDYPISKNIKIYQYNSYTMNKNLEDKIHKNKNLGVLENER